MNPSSQKISILGGAGFIGSNLAHHLSKSGHVITVIDGLLPQTGGREKNVSTISKHIEFINLRIEEVKELPSLLAEQDIIIDAMAWTSHRAALNDPIYDQKLNAESHLHLLNALPTNAKPRIIFLGSRGQYGSPNTPEITEDTPMQPQDIQGIHKVAAESYFKIYAKLKNLSVISLRLPNCYGPHQPVNGSDIGLVGEFIKTLLNGEVVEIFGANRIRSLLYVDDLVTVVDRLIHKQWHSFHAFNVAGQEFTIEELAKQIQKILNKGSLTIGEAPLEVKMMELGAAHFSDKKLRDFINEWDRTNLSAALSKTIHYFEKELT